MYDEILQYYFYLTLMRTKNWQKNMQCQFLKNFKISMIDIECSNKISRQSNMYDSILQYYFYLTQMLTTNLTKNTLKQINCNAILFQFSKFPCHILVSLIRFLDKATCMIQFRSYIFIWHRCSQRIWQKNTLKWEMIWIKNFAMPNLFQIFQIFRDESWML